MTAQAIALTAAAVVLYPFIGGFTHGWIMRHFDGYDDTMEVAAFLGGIFWPIFWLAYYAVAKPLWIIVRAGARIGDGAKP